MAGPPPDGHRGSQAQPPRAAARPRKSRVHGLLRVDPYAWLARPDDPQVRSHLAAEEAYTEVTKQAWAGLEDQILATIRARIRLQDQSVPRHQAGFWYYSRTEDDLQYPIHCRRRGSMRGAEEVLLDENELARGRDYFALGYRRLSPSGRLLAYAVDGSGRELFELRLRDLQTGADLPTVAADVSYGAAFSELETELYYVRPDASMRPFQVWRHRLGGWEPDRLVLQEDDERFFVDVRLSASGEFILISARSETSAEWHYLPAQGLDAKPRLIRSRRVGVDYAAEHRAGGQFLILTNDSAPQFRLVEAAIGGPRRPWREVLAERAGVRLAGFEAHRDFVVLTGRSGGLSQIEIWPGIGEPQRLSPAKGVRSLRLVPDPNFDSSAVRFEHSSLASPTQTRQWDARTQRVRVLKRQSVPGHRPGDLRVRRIWARAEDGTSIPISLVGRADALLRPAPTVLYVYGAYEQSVEPGFRAERLALLERGLLFAIAHVRGGGEMGRAWYEAGRLNHKRNTFGDLVACARQLLASGLTAPGRLGLRGASAGGLSVAAALNMEPELFACAVLQVPFVDVLGTMLDPSLPLTVTEYEEWGDPRQIDAYRYIQSYSPYDNLHPARYPPVLATAGLNDSRVGYVEPLKWVLAMRAVSLGSGPTLLRVHRDGGHAGPSGRERTWRQEAEVAAFLARHLELAGDEIGSGPQK